VRGEVRQVGINDRVMVRRGTGDGDRDDDPATMQGAVDLGTEVTFQRRSMAGRLTRYFGLGLFD